ncbi:MAG: DUF4062 domain-containing protein [Candidatus Eremiobacteraeota bacterium]|nr:DUF4062 domain-containing protein [Candidatus Eremiobacteraeota bacterium]
MASVWKTLKVFISSTFRDMHAERDYLVRFVFPRLREELLKRRIHFMDIDLRWGVTSDRDVVEVCHEVIYECMPRFLCMLGERYGSIPPEKEESITADEIRCAILEHRDEMKYCFFYFRKPAATAEMVEEKPGDFREEPTPEEIRLYGNAGAQERADNRRRKLEELKSFIGEEGFEPYLYPARWDDRQKRLVDLEKFGERVYADIMASVDDEFGPVIPEEPDEFTLENEAMESFSAERVERFVLGNRKPILDEMIKFAEANGEPNLYVATGKPGIGKSALLGKFYMKYRDDHPGETIIPHFVGASAGSTDLRRTLKRLCHEIGQAARIEGEIPEDIKELKQRFFDLLREAGEGRKILLIIDAVNQMDALYNSHDMRWIPDRIPPGVRIVVSSVEHPALDALMRRRKKPLVRKIEELGNEDSRAIIDKFLSRYGKKMELEQIDALMEKRESGNPLYLLTAMEELRTLGVYEEITGRIAELPGNTKELFLWILKERLSKDPDFRDGEGNPIGEKLVRKFVSYMGISRHGMSQRELIDLIVPGNPDHDPPMLPDARGNVAALQRLLRPYLMRRGELMDFYHSQLRDAVEEEYLDEEQERVDSHRNLAEYFSSRGNKYIRTLSEMPYHQTHGRMWDELEKTLCDLRFIEAKCAGGMTYNLIADYNLALESFPEAQEEIRKKRRHDERIQRWIREIIEYSRKWSEARECRIGILPPLSRLSEKLRRAVDNEERQRIREEIEKSMMPDIPLPEIPQSARPWTKEEIRKDTERIKNNPTRIDRVRAFSQFVNSESHILLKPEYITFQSFCVQRAYNFADSGPVANSAEKIIESEENDILFLRHDKNRHPYNPHPALLRVMEGHKDIVNSVSVTPDGKRAVSGGGDILRADYTLRLWDLETGECLKIMSGHTSQVNSVSVTPDGKYAVSGSIDEPFRLWDLETGECLKIMSGHTSHVNSVSVTPDGKRMVSGRYDKTLRLWDLETRKCLKIMWGHTWSVTSVSITPDGKYAVSGSGEDFSVGDFKGDATIRLWYLETGECLKIMEGHTDTVNSISITPDGKRAVSGSGGYVRKKDITLRLWDLETGECLRIMEGHTNIINCVSITPDGKRAVSGSDDRTLRLWDMKTGECLKIMKGHTDGFRCISITPDGKRAVSGSGDETLRLWDLETGEYLKIMEGHTDTVNSISVTPDGKMAVSGSDDRTLRLWDMKTGECLKIMEGHIVFVKSVSVTPDGKRAVSGSWDQTLHLWDLETGECLKVMRGHMMNKVDYVSVTPDGKRAVSGSHDYNLRLWDLEIGECLKIMKGHTNDIRSASVTPDGKRAVSASGEYNRGDNTIRLWDLETGECLRIMEGHTNTVWSVSITQDGKYVVSGSGDKTLRLWDLETRKCLKKMKGHRGSVKSLSITPDGKRAVSGSWDKTLRLWDLETGECIAIMPIGRGVLTISDIRPDGTFVCGTSSGDVIILKIKNIPMEPPVITPVRIWLYEGSVGEASSLDKPSVGKTNSLGSYSAGGEGNIPGKWDENITALCLWCGKRFIVDNRILNTIMEIRRNAIEGKIKTGASLRPSQITNISIPDSAWEDPRLLSKCPVCEKSLRFNPFIVDNRGR